MNSSDSEPQVTSSTESFDPFRINSDHVNHSQSSNLIRLEASGRLLCCDCLARNPHEQLESIDYDVFESYVRSLFDLLQEHNENKIVRKVALPVMEIMLKKRTLIVRSDHDFHNILKVMEKVITHKYFNRYEFIQVVRIFSRLCSGFKNTAMMPLLSVWQFVEKMIEFADQHLGQMPDHQELTMDLMLLFETLSKLVHSYLRLINLFALDKFSDLIFPLNKCDTVMTHNRSKYHESQLRCLDFVRESLLVTCWTILKVNPEHKHLHIQDKNLVTDFFIVLKESFITAIRMKNEEFLKAIKKIDFIYFGHQYINRTNEMDVRNSLKDFLTTYVMEFIEREYGRDQSFDKMFLNSAGPPVRIETNYKNAIINSRDEKKSLKTSLYLMVNLVAMKLKSKYFTPWRVLRVLKSMDPSSMKINKSKTLMKIILTITSSLVVNLDELETTNLFIESVFRQYHDRSDNTSISELIAFNENIFFWCLQTPSVRPCINENTVAYFLEKFVDDNDLNEVLAKFLDCSDHSLMFDRYLDKVDSSVCIIRRLIKRETMTPNIYSDVDGNLTYHKRVTDHLSYILPTLLHQSILELNHDVLTKTSSEKINKFIVMTTLMIKACQHFDMIVDDTFIDDLFQMYQRLCRATDSERLDETIILLNDLVASIISNDSPYLFKFLKCLDYYTLGYLIYFLSQYKLGDELGESVASLLVKYDDLDYPLAQDICKNLYPNADHSFYWFLSNNIDMNILSIKLAQRVMLTDTNDTTKACISTGLLHVLFKRPEILQSKRHLQIIKKLIINDEFIYNPLLVNILDDLPDVVRKEISYKAQESDPGANSASFSESESSSEDEGPSILNILTNLDEDGDDDHNRIPSSIMITNSVPRDAPLYGVDTDEWERRAYEINKTLEITQNN